MGHEGPGEGRQPLPGPLGRPSRGRVTVTGVNAAAPEPASAPAVVAGPGGLDPHWIAAAVATALDEDLGGAPGRDVTTQATISPDAVGTAALVARADGVVAGLV